MNEIIFFIHCFAVIIFLLVFKKLGKSALIFLVSLQVILANLFVIKQIRLFGFFVTPTDAFTIGIVLTLNFLQEYYGKKEAKKAIVLSFFSMIFFVVFSKIHLFYAPLLEDGIQNSFEQIFSSTPRIFLSSVAVFYFVQFLDIYVFSYLRNKLHNFFYLRMMISLILTQIIDTVLFSFLALYGIVESIKDIILLSFLIKMIASLTSVFLLYLWGKKEKVFYEI